MSKKVLFILLCLFFFKGYSQGISIVTPANNYYSPVYTVSFSWNPVLNVSSYRIRIGTDSFFTGTLKDTIITGTTFSASFNTSNSRIYWKVYTASATSYLEGPLTTLNFMSPFQNPNILFWTAGDQGTHLQPDSTVDTWKCILNDGNNASQANPSFRPKLSVVSQLNNMPVIHFDGIDDVLSFPAGGPIANAYVIFNWTGAATFPSYVGVLANTLVPPATTDYLFDGVASSTLMYGGYYGSNNFYINNTTQTGNLSPLGKYKVVSGRKNPPYRTFSGFLVGRDPDPGSGYWNGDIAEIVVSKFSSPGESDSIHTYLYNKYAPPVSLGKDIIAGTSFSDTVVLDAGVRFSSFLWNSGNVTQTTRVATAGTYSVKVKDIFGRESTDDIMVYPYRRLNNASVFLCSGDSLVLNLGITSPQFLFNWSTGSTSSQITIKNSGQYTVNITDSKGKQISDTINVFIGSPVLSPALPPSNTINLCFNEKLFVTSPSAFDSIHWSTGSSAPFIVITTPGTYSIYARTVNGCILNKTFTVNIAGNAPVADFNASTICQNASASFTDLSTFPLGNSITSWKWTFGDGNTSPLQNPSNTYTSTGAYSAALKITTNVGCTDSISKIIIVNKRPSVSFSNRLSCSGNPTLFIDETIANSSSLSDWKWDFGGLGIINSITNPTFTFQAAGIYNVKLITTNSNGCIDSITKPVIVDPSPVANFAFDSVCGRSPVNFKWLSSVAPPADILIWRWDFGDGSFNSGSLKEPPHPYPGPGTYNVSLIVFSTDQCVDTAQKLVKVFDFPTVDFEVSQTQCTGKEIQFTDISTTPDSTPITKWNWYFSGQSISTNQNPRYTFAAEGNYTVQLTAANAVGCSGTKLRSVAVSNPPAPKFTFSPQYGLPPLTVVYTNQSSNTGTYFWDYGDGSPLVAAYNPPSHTYTTRGSYPIKLIATDFRGCTDTLTKYILVDRAYLDAVLATMNIIPDGDFYKVQVTIVNSSNIELRTMGLSLRLGSGSVIRENWTGSLMPGQSVIYLFTGEIKLSDNQIPVICATIDNINDNSPEDRTDNNSLCKEVKVGQFDVLNVYPNPSYGNINFGVMLPQDGIVSIGFVDYLGQIMYKKDFTGVKGYNNLSMTTMPLNAAVYVAVISYNGETIRKKFMRGDRK